MQQIYRRSRHSVSALHAHLVFVTKYRRPVCTGEMLSFVEYTMPTVCAELGVELVEFNSEADYVYMLVAYPPRLAISKPVQWINGRTAYAVRRGYTGRCAGALMPGHLWSPSDFAASCGGAPLSIIKQHIDGQA